jgi:large subunit ribosomal protein L15
VPKFGFTSAQSLVRAVIRLHELTKVKADVITLESLKASNVIGKKIKFVKVIASGEISSPVTLQGIPVTSGAKKAIESAGGRVQE